MQIHRCQPSESRHAAEWLKENHYLKCTPPGFVFVLEFLDGTRHIGSHLWGRPAPRELNADKILQLHRMHFVDDTERFVESQSLKLARKFIRTWFPRIKLVLSYSDPEEGHEGTVYEADNWCEFGRTKKVKGYGWKSRNGRRDTICSSKIRWVRTP